jgi:hypothetical protein
MHDLLIRLDSRTENIATDVLELKHTINGNGTPGIKDIVVRHDERVKAIESRTVLGRKELAALWTGLVGALVALAHVVERLVH